MKKSKSIFLAAMLLASCIRETETPASARIDPGDPWPPFVLTAPDNTTLSNEDLRGKTVLIVFFSTECADCRRELPAVEAAWEELKNDPRFIIVPVGRRQSAGTIAAYWAERQWDMPFYPDPDGAVYALFAAHTVPYFFAGGPDGTVRFIKAETLDMEARELTGLLKSLAGTTEK